MSRHYKDIPFKGPHGGKLIYSTGDGDSKPKTDQTVYEKRGFNDVEKREVRWDPSKGKFRK